ncbi:hypothetical protein [Amycolatopsis sp. EV170708-02-1]|uniref:hypothetical protein n=1 Tax=Amycolatopsis sp. EV170708-02-1 TaxID=2919322 RepID=UPI001F0BF49B|nr:hypothetical protein [Amycolatopsis sp. EV170708-02-1]UMP05570.1 hypothetical protein MJQ72_12390 [Amycolatopsis sp. EV170708-02-1]
MGQRPETTGHAAGAGIVEQFKDDEVALANAPAEAGIVAAHTDAEVDAEDRYASSRRPASVSM